MRARSLVAILVCLQWFLGASTVSFAASAPGTEEIKAGGFGGDAVSSWPVLHRSRPRLLCERRNTNHFHAQLRADDGTDRR